MKISKITNWMVAGAACLLLGTSCDVDPTFYSQVVPDTYYTNADAIWSRFNRPFTHWRWWVAHNDARVRLMEVGTDAMCVLLLVVMTGLMAPFIRTCIIIILWMI